MISIDHLCKTLLTCKDLPVNINKINNLSGDKFIQKDSIQIQLDKLNIIEKEQHKFDYDTSSKSINDIIIPTIKNIIKDTNEIIIPSRALLNYQENNIITNLPSILLDAFQKIPELNNWTLYGFKNPESFTKSILILHKADFIIKGRYDRMSTVYTFKKEMGLHLPKYFKKIDYKEMKFKQSEMMKLLLSKEHHHSYDFMVFCADYCQINLLIIDILNNSFCEIKHKLLDHSNESLPDYNNYFIIIKYINNTFLPLLSKTSHKISSSNIEKIKQNFEDESKMANINYIPRKYQNLVEHDIKKTNTSKTSNTSNTSFIQTFEDDLAPIEITEPLINMSKYDIELPDIYNLPKNTKTQQLEDLNSKIDFDSEQPINHSISSTLSNNVDKIKSSLKLISSYSLNDLQCLANKFGIEIKKNGKTKIVNKTKKELYDELSSI
jgi:hypothetical protein